MEDKIKLYTYTLPPNETLYKGMQTNKMDMQHPSAVWFSQRMDTAQLYGSYVHSVLTTRPLKLINITSPYFQSTFMDFLNDFFRREPESHKLKMELLAPIGLPDEKSQDTFLQSIGAHPITNLTNAHQQDLYKNVAFFYNRHRYSDTLMDATLVEFLKDMHVQYNFDGYIAPCIWPTKYHAKFSDEICLFNIRTVLQYNTFVKRPTKGGGPSTNHVQVTPKMIEATTMHSMEILKSFKWNAPYELYPGGILKSPTAWELGRHSQKLHQERVDAEGGKPLRAARNENHCAKSNSNTPNGSRITAKAPPRCSKPKKSMSPV